MSRKVLAILLAVCFFITLIPQYSLAQGAQGVQTQQVSVKYKDISKHPARDAILRWAERGVIDRTKEEFRPDSTITRAEFCSIMNKVFRYVNISKVKFDDIKTSDWYYDVAMKAREAGIFGGNKDRFLPKNTITRQDAAVVIFRAFKLPEGKIDKLKPFKDYNKISDYAKPAVASLLSSGYISINTDKTFKPVENITRADAIVLLDNIAGEFLSTKWEGSKGDVKKSIVINASGVYLKDTNIKGNLYITEGVGEGEITLENISVNGSVFVEGGGTHSVIIKSSKLASVYVNKRNNPVRVDFEGNTAVSYVEVKSEAKVEFSEETVIEKLEVSKEAKGSAVEGKGTIKALEVQAEDITVNGKKVDAGDSLEVKSETAKDDNKNQTPVISPGSGGTTYTPPSQRKDWTLVWNDEFNGSTINSANWTVVNTAEVYNNEDEAYKPENAYIEDGKLVLEAKKEDYLGKNYTSAKLVTQGKQHWTYGKFEVRAKMPESRGMWPAIWMLPEDDNLYGGWPLGGEVDIMELLGHEPGKTYGTIHYGNPHGSGQGTYTLPEGRKFSEDYHVYSIEWEPGEIRWYIDRQLFYTENKWFTRDPNQADSITYPAPFDRDFYLILNLAVGGDWPGHPDGTTVFPSKMYVDYARVYSLTGRAYRDAGERPVDNNTSVRPPLEDGNYIYNGSFDQQVEGTVGISNTTEGGVQVANTSYWTFSHVAANDGTADASIDNGALKVDISNGGINTYSVQFYQKPINLEKGESYRVSFDAKASANRNMSVKLGSEADRGWANYSGDQVIALTNSMQPNTFDFIMQGETNSGARIEFNLGKEGANTVWIDNVRIEKLPKDPNAARDALPSGNLVYNGSFDQGSKSMGFWNFTTTKGAVAVGSVDTNPYLREFKAVISNGGTDSNSVVLSQDPLNIENGKTYKVTFMARASTGRTIDINVGSAADASKSYSALQTASLTTNSKVYSFNFNMTENTDIKAQLQFLLGGNTGTVYIDNVSVKSIVPTQAVRIEAEDTTGSGVALGDGYVSFNDITGSSITANVNIPVTGNYVISYRVGADKDTGWLSVGDSEHKETIPASGSLTSWQIVTDSVYLEAGTQDIAVFGNNVNLDYFELSKDKVLDGAMSSSSGNWVFWANSPASASKSNEKGKVKFSVTSPGANPWDMGFQQQNIGMEKGKLYRLSFDAASDVSRTIRVSLDNLDDTVTYTKYLQKDINISSTIKNFIFDFTMEYDSDANAALTYSLGKISTISEAHNIYLDNIRLTEITDMEGEQVINAPVATETPDPGAGDPGSGQPVGVNLITDGTFDTDMGAWTLAENGGAATATVSGGALYVDVTTVGDLNYKPQVVKSGLTLGKDAAYKVTFKARATTDRGIEIGILDPSNSYHYFGGGKVDLTSNEQTFEIAFTADASTTTAVLQFNFGTIDGKTSVPSSIYLDDITLVKQ